MPLGDLPREAAQHRHFVVVGAGKTSMDAVCRLRFDGAESSQLTW